VSPDESPSTSSQHKATAALAVGAQKLLTFGQPHAHRFDHSETRPEIVARLEWLDDLMFAAIEGDPAALEAASDAWKKSLEELGGTTLEESRLQYLRRAQTVWNALRSDGNQPPQRVFAAIELISLLAGKAR
jgi:hypothetical protein